MNNKQDISKQITVITCMIIGLLMPPMIQAQEPNHESSWVQGEEYRLKTEIFQSDKMNKRPIMVIVLHGDSPFNNPDYQNTFAAKVAANIQNTVTIAILRPGYTDHRGNISEGRRGKTNGDNWNAKNTHVIADAIRTLQNRYQSRKVVVAGHSGGAAITANILGLEPDLIDAALLVSCPCDAKKWRKSMFNLTGSEIFKGEIETLSPIEQITNISDQVTISMIVGTRDEVTPPYLSENYFDNVASLGKDIRLTQLEDKGHEIFLDDKVFDHLTGIID